MPCYCRADHRHGRGQVVRCHYIGLLGVAGTWLTSQAAYDSGASVWCARMALRRTLLWSAVKLITKYADFSHCWIAWDAVNGVSHVTYRMVYKKGQLIHGSWILDIFLTAKKEGRLVCGSTFTCVHTIKWKYQLNAGDVLLLNSVYHRYYAIFYWVHYVTTPILTL